MSVIHQLFIVWGLCVERWRQEVLPALLTKLDLQYPVFEKRCYLNSWNYRWDIFAAGDLVPVVDGLQILEFHCGPSCWPYHIECLWGLKGNFFNRNAVLVVHMHNEQSLASIEQYFCLVIILVLWIQYSIINSVLFYSWYVWLIPFF